MTPTQQPTPKKIFGFVFILLWMTAGILAYVYGHRPFGPEFVGILLLNLWAVGVSFWVLALAGGLGRRVLAKTTLPPLAEASLQACLGVAITSTVIFIWGSVLPINAGLLWALAGMTTVLLRKDMRGWSQRIFGVWREMGREKGYPRIILGMTGLLLLLTLFKSLAPPLAYDAQVYHLVLPLRHLAAGKILIYDDLLFSGFPQMLHMQYLWLVALGVQTPAVFMWSVGLLALTTIWQAAKAWFSPAAAATALAALLTSNTMIEALSIGYLDWAGIWVGALALIVFTQWREDERKQNLMLAGILAGIAIAYKYTFGVLLLFMLVGVLWQNRKTPRKILRQGLGLGLSAALVAAPWLLKNWLVTGNPIYPLLFPAGAMTAERVALYSTANETLAWADIVFIPFRATFWGIHNGTLGGAPNFQGEVGPLLLLLGGIGLLGNLTERPEARRAVESAGLFAVVGMVLWALATTFAAYLIFPRHYYVMFPAFAILAAYGFSVTLDYTLFDVRVQRITMAFVLLAFGFTTIQYTLRAVEGEAVQVALGVKSAEDYLLDELGMQLLFSQTIKERYGAGEVLLLWETRSYYCAPACIPDDNANRWIYTWREHGDVDEILTLWQGQGIEYIAIRQEALDFVWTEAEQAEIPELVALQALKERLILEESFNDAYLLYRIP